VASKLIGKMLGIKSAPIEFGIEGKRRWLRIKDLLQLQIEATEGRDLTKGHLWLIQHSVLYLAPL
jgi:hypothetical protein